CLSVQIATILLAIRFFSASARGPRRRGGGLRDFTRVANVMLLLMTGVILQIAIWAGLYGLLDLFDDAETALYFSGVTFTSLGYGDIVLKQPVRLLAPLEAATGLLMFGITTAVLIGALQFGENRAAEAGKPKPPRAPKNAPKE
ncbi:MAG TPA: potassium channel family protein, partial [Polymorphobacter sp.]|nr:potassium channel family protein [Polymorphobacter sp.]